MKTFLQLHPNSVVVEPSDLQTAIRYAIVTPPAITNGTTISATLQDRAINTVQVAPGVTTLDLTFPVAVSGYARDFFVRIVTAGTDLATVGLVESTTGYSEFSTATSYTVGDRCVFNGVLYECTTAHSAGAWDDNDFGAVTPDVEIGLDDLTDWNKAGTHLVLFTEIEAGKWLASKRFQEVSS